MKNVQPPKPCPDGQYHGCRPPPLLCPTQHRSSLGKPFKEFAGHQGPWSRHIELADCRHHFAKGDISQHGNIRTPTSCGTSSTDTHNTLSPTVAVDPPPTHGTAPLQCVLPSRSWDGGIPQMPHWGQTFTRQSLGMMVEGGGGL